MSWKQTGPRREQGTLFVHMAEEHATQIALRPLAMRMVALRPTLGRDI